MTFFGSDSDALSEVVLISVSLKNVTMLQRPPKCGADAPNERFYRERFYREGSRWGRACRKRPARNAS